MHTDKSNFMLFLQEALQVLLPVGRQHFQPWPIVHVLAGSRIPIVGSDSLSFEYLRTIAAWMFNFLNTESPKWYI